jgi:hypothetical protein
MLRPIAQTSLVFVMECMHAGMEPVIWQDNLGVRNQHYAIDPRIHVLHVLIALIVQRGTHFVQIVINVWEELVLYLDSRVQLDGIVQNKINHALNVWTMEIANTWIFVMEFLLVLQVFVQDQVIPVQLGLHVTRVHTDASIVLLTLIVMMDYFALDKITVAMVLV